MNNINVEVVPGLTSGVAVPSYFGIPLTHRLAGSSVTFVTGHEGIEKKQPNVNWKLLAKSTNTLVIYMGVHNLQYIVEELLEGGLLPQTPSVVIQQGTVIGQRFLKTTLANLTAEVNAQKFTSPSLIIIGEVLNFQVHTSAPSPANVTMPISF